MTRLAVLVLLSVSISATAHAVTPVEVKFDVALQANVDGDPSSIRVIITNRTKGSEMLVQDPERSRNALAFFVSDARGNLVEPTGIAKVDPKTSHLKMKKRAISLVVKDTQHGRLAKNASLFLPFLSGTGLFGYKLKKGETYRVIAVFRPHGLAGQGFTSGELALKP